MTIHDRLHAASVALAAAIGAQNRAASLFEAARGPSRRDAFLSLDVAETRRHAAAEHKCALLAELIEAKLNGTAGA